MSLQFQTKWSSSHRKKKFFSLHLIRKVSVEWHITIGLRKQWQKQRNANGRERQWRQRVAKRERNEAVRKDHSGTNAEWWKLINSASATRHKNDQKIHFDPGHNKINYFSLNFICLPPCSLLYDLCVLAFSFLFLVKQHKQNSLSFRFGHASAKAIGWNFVYRKFWAICTFAHLHTVPFLFFSVRLFLILLIDLMHRTTLVHEPARRRERKSACILRT